MKRFCYFCKQEIYKNSSAQNPNYICRNHTNIDKVDHYYLSSKTDQLNTLFIDYGNTKSFIELSFRKSSTFIYFGFGNGDELKLNYILDITPENFEEKNKILKAFH